MTLQALLPRLLRLAALLGLGWGAYGGLLYWLQDALIYPAPGGIGADQLDLVAQEQGANSFRLLTDDGIELYGWHRPVQGAATPRLVIYFHGNGESVAGNVPLQRLLQQAGWDFLTVAYRGYPGSGGRPSEEGLRVDAHALWTYATGPLGYPPERIVFHGRSLGGGVAIQLATTTNPRGMVLESTFHSLREVAERRAPFLPVSLLLRSPFESWALAPRVGVPVLELHSRDDEIIPVDHGRRLSQRFAEAEYVEVEGYTHNDVLPAADDRLRATYVAFLDRLVPR